MVPPSLFGGAGSVLEGVMDRPDSLVGSSAGAKRPGLRQPSHGPSLDLPADRRW